jgi:predicted phosphodiesterase
MQATTAVLLAIILAAAASVLNFKFLFYPLFPSLNPTAHKEHLKLNGKTLFISDLHLESERVFEYSRELRAFIESGQVSNLVVNGDLFNSPEDAQAVLADTGPDSVLRRLGLEGLQVNCFWVIGSPPHDPSNLPNPNNAGGFRVVGDCVEMDFGRTIVLVYHGHDMGVKGFLSHAWDRFISRLSLERAWKKLAKVDKDTWVFFGHTHIPGIDPKLRVANSGGWQTVPLVRPTKTGLLISEESDEPELVTIA